MGERLSRREEKYDKCCRLFETNDNNNNNIKNIASVDHNTYNLKLFLSSVVGCFGFDCSRFAGCSILYLHCEGERDDEVRRKKIEDWSRQCRESIIIVYHRLVVLVNEERFPQGILERLSLYLERCFDLISLTPRKKSLIHANPFRQRLESSCVVLKISNRRGDITIQITPDVCMKSSILPPV